MENVPFNSSMEPFLLAMTRSSSYPLSFKESYDHLIGQIQAIFTGIISSTTTFSELLKTAQMLNSHPLSLSEDETKAFLLELESNTGKYKVLTNVDETYNKAINGELFIDLS